jgi:hypothetical protein
MDFTLVDKDLNIKSKALVLEKVLTLAGIEHYVNGTLDVDVALSNYKETNGHFSVNSNNLKTQPTVMEKTIGSPLQLDIALASKGIIENNHLKANISIKTFIGELDLRNTQVNLKTKALSADYIINIADLQKAKVLTGANLYGSVVLKGKIQKSKVLTVSGNTTSVGGKFLYKLVKDTLTINIDKVPLENILGLMGQDKAFIGLVSGTLQQNMKQKMGNVNLDINGFKIKPASWTQTATILLGKDPSRIIFDSTKLKATIQGKKIHYTLNALGSRSSITISEGILDIRKNVHTA